MSSISVVPTGLVFSRTPDPGTEVPGYFHFVPPGLKTAKLKRRMLNSLAHIISGKLTRLRARFHCRWQKEKT